MTKHNHYLATFYEIYRDTQSNILISDINTWDGEPYNAIKSAATENTKNPLGKPMSKTGSTNPSKDHLVRVEGRIRSKERVKPSGWLKSRTAMSESGQTDALIERNSTTLQLLGDLWIDKGSEDESYRDALSKNRFFCAFSSFRANGRWGAHFVAVAR